MNPNILCIFLSIIFSLLFTTAMVRRILLSIFLVVYSFSTFAQDGIVEKLGDLYENEQYEQIIAYAETSENYSAESLYYIGYAFFVLEDDEKALLFINRSIELDPEASGPNYIKGVILMYMGQFDEAIASYQKAIEQKPDEYYFYSALGDCYLEIQDFENALSSYQKAIKEENASPRLYGLIAEVYDALGEQDKALEALYDAKSNIDPESNYYITTLYNIGLMEMLQGNHDVAEEEFLNLIELAPNDYYSYAKLIQIYYHRKEYDRAKPYREILYTAHENNQLEGTISEMFCFDQFEVKGNLVQVFERYQSGKSNTIYYKHIFYVVNEGDILFTVQTEYSPIAVEFGSPKYILCATTDEAHLNYGKAFDDDLDYDNLKSEAISIITNLLKK